MARSTSGMGRLRVATTLRSTGVRIPSLLLGGAGIVLIPWIAVLAIVVRHSTGWVVLDVLEAVCLLTTAVLLRRGGEQHRPAALAAALLLSGDAWFDVRTAAPGSALAIAVAMAVLAELPLAALCLAMAKRPRRATAGAAPRSSTSPALRKIGTVAWNVGVAIREVPAVLRTVGTVIRDAGTRARALGAAVLHLATVLRALGVVAGGAVTMVRVVGAAVPEVRAAGTAVRAAGVAVARAVEMLTGESTAQGASGQRPWSQLWQPQRLSMQHS
ncbi:hypothetical protein ACIGXM_23990 [Kitasatospora sp. NPDC052896]|uniref:hypothetical protein n=1 Tax=Kitasatospora sp. NPDC052896 TaxID=3364061 RepID=UPI0037CBAD44